MELIKIGKCFVEKIGWFRALSFYHTVATEYCKIMLMISSQQINIIAKEIQRTVIPASGSIP